MIDNHYNLEPVNTVSNGRANTAKGASTATSTLDTLTLRTHQEAITDPNNSSSSSSRRRECRVSSTYISSFSLKSPGSKKATTICGDSGGQLLSVAFLGLIGGRWSCGRLVVEFVSVTAF